MSKMRITSHLVQRTVSLSEISPGVVFQGVLQVPGNSAQRLDIPSAAPGSAEVYVLGNTINNFQPDGESYRVFHLPSGHFTRIYQEGDYLSVIDYTPIAADLHIRPTHRPEADEREWESECECDQ